MYWKTVILENISLKKELSTFLDKYSNNRSNFVKKMAELLNIN